MRERRSHGVAFFAAFLLLAAAFPSHAAEPLALGRKMDGVFFGDSVLHFEDKSKQLTFDQIKSAEILSKFAPDRQKSLNFGLSDSNHWLYFKVKNNGSAPTSWWLQMEYTLFSNLDVYEAASDGSFAVHTGGNQISIDEHDERSRKNIFRMNTPPGGGEVFVKISPIDAMVMDAHMTAWDEESFDDAVGLENLALGLYYGALLALIFYNLFVLVSVRDLSYLWYILYLSFAALDYFAINGLGFKYWWGNSAYAAREWPLSFYLLAYTFAFMFARSFLEIKKNLGRMDGVIRACAIISGLLALISLTDLSFHFVATIAYPATIVYAPLLIYVGVRSLGAGVRQARYFAAAWIVFLIGMPVYILKDLGFLPNSWFSVYSVQIGTLLDAVLLSLALADRINILRGEKEKAEALARDALVKSMNVLEAMVAERTRKLSESEARLKGLSDSTFEAIVVHENGIILDANRAAEQMIGFSKEELIGKNAIKLFIAPESEELSRKIIASGSEEVFEISGLKRGGEKIHAETRGRNIDFGGRPARVVALRDVTARKNAESALKAAKEAAERATRLKDTFVSIVTHDLRSPVGGIKMSLQILMADKSLGEKNRSHLSMLVDSCKGLLEMVDRLLEISRMQRGNVRPVKKKIPARLVIDRAVERLRPVAEKKGVSMRNDVPEGLLLLTDADLLLECVANLAANAIKFTEKGGEVSFFNPDGKQGVLCVRDNGVGISPDILPDIFKMEVKTTTVGTDGETGTGMGLPYCNEVMAALGGSIRAESEPGKGSSFYLEIPEWSRN